MPKYRGRVDCYMNPSNDGTGNVSSRMVSELFCNIVQHISQSGPELGIEMIAANYGVPAGSIGTGFQFWDEGNPPGHRAWAVFRFHSASYGKFDCMVFMASGSGVTYSPMNIGTNGSSLAFSSRGNVGIAFALHPSGSNTGSADGPWNGSYSLTSASIGLGSSGVSSLNPVWKLNDQNRGAFFPRANGIFGTYSGSRNHMGDCFDDEGITWNPLLAHIVLTEDSVTVLTDYAITNNYKVVHFGPFEKRSEMRNFDSSYVYWNNGSRSTAPLSVLWTTTFGVYAGTRAGADGAITHYDLSSGSIFGSFYRLGLGTIGDSNLGFNFFLGGGTYERFPLLMIGSENRDQLGIVGRLKHLDWTIGPPTNSVSTNSGSVVIGTTTVNQTKILMPWSGSFPGSLTGVRTGRSMNFDT